MDGEDKEGKEFGDILDTAWDDILDTTEDWRCTCGDYTTDLCPLHEDEGGNALSPAEIRRRRNIRDNVRSLDIYSIRYSLPYRQAIRDARNFYEGLLELNYFTYNEFYYYGSKELMTDHVPIYEIAQMFNVPTEIVQQDLWRELGTSTPLEDLIDRGQFPENPNPIEFETRVGFPSPPPSPPLPGIRFGPAPYMRGTRWVGEVLDEVQQMTFEEYSEIPPLNIEMENGSPIVRVPGTLIGIYPDGLFEFRADPRLGDYTFFRRGLFSEEELKQVDFVNNYNELVFNDTEDDFFQPIQRGDLRVYPIVIEDENNAIPQIQMDHDDDDETLEPPSSPELLQFEDQG